MTYHGVLRSQALCGFTRESPVDWENGHKAVPFYQIDDITCETCRAEAVKHLSIADEFPKLIELSRRA